MASINEKLNKIDSNIADMRTILNLEENTSIEEVKGALIPEIGFKVTEWTEDGYAKTIQTYGYKTLPQHYLGSSVSYESATVLSKKLEKVILNEGLQEILSGAFEGLSNLKTIIMPSNEILLNTQIMRRTKVKQISVKNFKNGTDNTGFSSGFAYAESLIAIWLGGAFDKSYVYLFNNCSNLKKVYMDLPRASMEKLSGYQYNFSSPNGVGIIICNDDENFITQEEFDAIDWENYTV